MDMMTRTIPLITLPYKWALMMQSKLLKLRESIKLKFLEVSSNFYTTLTGLKMREENRFLAMDMVTVLFILGSVMSDGLTYTK